MPACDGSFSSDTEITADPGLISVLCSPPTISQDTHSDSDESVTESGENRVSSPGERQLLSQSGQPVSAAAAVTEWPVHEFETGRLFFIRHPLTADMRLPVPAYGAYVEFVVTVLTTLAVLQYVGVFGQSGSIEITSLAGVGLSLPICTYFQTVVCANSPWISQWDRMVQDDR
ncbi:MAG: hypothetical protein J07HX64_00900 [halophilic archaeon J07HX64]|nr:MAG: hypothetical protein J07HX64_00900 [halophilic archaeon J07HX64]